MYYYVSRLALLALDGAGALHRKHPLAVFAILLVSTLTLAGCDLIVDIFQAGVWVGVILVVLVIGLVVWLFTRSRA